MMRLFRVELLRWRWRRAVWALVLCALAVPVVVFAVTAWDTRPVSDAEMQRAEALVQEELDRRHFQRSLERCERRPEQFGVAESEDCLAELSPRPEWFLPREQLDPATVVNGPVVGIVVVAVGLLMLAATTFAGADWNSGSMSNQLLFEPRRGRIWWAKGLVVAVNAAVVTAVVMAGFWVAVRMLAAARDISVPAAASRDLWAMTGRSVALAAGAALTAYAVTMLFRSTVFTVSAMFTLAIATIFVPLMLGLPENWSLHMQVAAVLQDGAQYYRNPPMACYEDPGAGPPAGLDCREYGEVTLRAGATYLAVFAAACVAASKAAFLRRDVP